MIRNGILGLALAAALIGTTHAQAAGNAALVKRGDYLVNTIMTCGNCHTPKGPKGDIPGKHFSGGLSWDEPPFKVTAPNITQDKDTGIGNGAMPTSRSCCARACVPTARRSRRSCRPAFTASSPNAT